MTSETETMKTNEFLRRRMLRLQQVREQSKDIAKKIRQRAKVEKLKHIIDIDSKKEKEYFQHQEKLVKRLEQLYAKQLQNVGAGHLNAAQVSLQNVPEITDLSKARGKEAIAALRKKKQVILDEQKKLLDRKLQAREAANEISREKSSVTSVKQTSSNKINGDAFDVSNDPNNKGVDKKDAAEDDKSKPQVTKSDIATQWDISTMPNEWEPNIPKLVLSTTDTVEDSANNNKSDKNKRINLFALSDEMPSSLRGGQISVPEDTNTFKPSLTIVTEYLQNRALRLREPDTSCSIKRQEDLKSIKQTILRTRSSKTEGRICHVLDEQVIPVPSWHAEVECEFCPHTPLYKNPPQGREFKSVTNSEINKIFKSIRPDNQNLLPMPVLRGASPFRRNKLCHKAFSPKRNILEKSISTAPNIISKKNSVTMYNHNTRDMRDIPRNETLVVRDLTHEVDAYSQATRKSANDDTLNKEQKKIQEMRNKIALTKQNVEKEYKDTMAFLSSIPKDKDKPIKSAYMDESRQQMQRESRQQKLQQEFRKVERECRKHSCQNAQHKITCERRSKSKSPNKVYFDNDFDSKDFQYSWMPVPESDGNLAIHTIPTTVKEGKTGNTVKFSKIDSYHEYRSRHKHTPPTKDITDHDKSKKRVVETVIIDKNGNESTDTSSIATDASSVESTRIDTTQNKKSNQNLSDAERIVIYKILESKKDKKDKKTIKLIRDIAKSLSSVDKEKIQKYLDEKNEHIKLSSHEIKNVNTTNERNLNRVSVEQLHEGVYKAVNEKGVAYNITSCYTTNVELWQSTTDCIPWWDNIANVFYSDNTQVGDTAALQQGEVRRQTQCDCNNKHQTQYHKGASCTNETGETSNLTRTTPQKCKCSSRVEGVTNVPPAVHTSGATSTTSFKTATNDKANNPVADGGYIKLVDDNGQEAGKFYIGATGILKDDAFEMVIQLRKKDIGKETDKQSEKNEPLTNEAVQVKEPDSQHVSRILEEEVRADKSNNSKYETKAISSQEAATNKSINVPDTEDLKDDVIDNKIGVQTTSCTDIQQGIESSENNNLCDKGVVTSFQNSFILPNHVAGPNSAPKAGTSVCTQTSLNSSNHKPVLIHMSSSTSTAYMSPPEMILPKFLTQNYTLSIDDNYDPSQNSSQQDPRVKILRKGLFGEDLSECRCKRCAYDRKVNSNKVNVSLTEDKKSSCRHKKQESAPNTCRGFSTVRGQGVSRSTSAHSSPIPAKHKCKRSHGNCRNSKIYTKSQKRKDNTISSKHPSRNNLIRVCTSTASSHYNKKNSKCTVNKKGSKSSLNPIIEDYVNKLLALNREGLKAVDIINQECSTVDTPGSSIIEVPHNTDNNSKTSANNKITLQQIKDILKQKIILDCKKQQDDVHSEFIRTCRVHSQKRKTVHKVKSFNVSRNLLKKKSVDTDKQRLRHLILSKSAFSSSSNTSNESKKYKNPVKTTPSKMKSSHPPRSKSSPPSRAHSAMPRRESVSDNTDSKEYTKNTTLSSNNKNKPDSSHGKSSVYPPRKAPSTLSASADSEDVLHLNRHMLHINKQHEELMNVTQTSTQTGDVIDNEIQFMKLAEDKLENMEKIADLTEKCTKRLSNLAKVLEEVRKNKSLAYTHIVTDSSDSDRRSDVNTPTGASQYSVQEAFEIPIVLKRKSPSPPPAVKEVTSEYVPLLTGIPKPDISISPLTSGATTTENCKTHSTEHVHSEHSNTKCRNKPPPALSRINLKRSQENLIPHELSTVLEVDSPMSVKLKHSSQKSIPESFNQTNKDSMEHEEQEVSLSKEQSGNPDLLQTNIDTSKVQIKKSSTDSSDESKIQMMDLKKFNEIMLKPFISLKDYAKQCNVEAIDEGSNLDDIPKEELNDDLSSLHSDGSLPDVIAELLKRNIISEPFKFDTASNVNSTSVSSESTLSMLALSKARKERKKSNAVFQHKENIVETSDTLSVSSNPDLENAFKKLGMGWASSTLKRTKERLALSSSSNTSSSSTSQLKVRSFNKQNIPTLVSATISSDKNVSKKTHLAKDGHDGSKNAEQQTSLTKSMTVKEFLTNELANKITFTNRSNRNDTEEEFVSLFETKIPEETKHSLHALQARDEHSTESGTRARTSTPVQIYKSAAYQTSSSSNLSNGLFSNADLSSVKGTSNSLRNHSTSDKDDLTIPNCSLRMRKGLTDSSKSD